ncbi:MAG: hypothetical protein AB8B86_04195 [Pseudomonadales bacterium]
MFDAQLVKTSFSRNLLLAWLMAAPVAAELRPFESDGCSAFPDGNLEVKKAWLRCCVVHDYDYWKGGSYEDRLASDRRLEQCVTEVGEPELAVLMLVGVRVGGTPFLPTTFRWGYGWSEPRFYASLTEAENNSVSTQGKPSDSVEREWLRLGKKEEWYEQF